jgi:DNA mismatch repair protein MutS2
VVYKTNFENVYLILAGPYAPNPTEILGDEQFGQLLKAARQVFEYVLIDTPPLGAVVDAAVISQFCDGAAIVVESGVTSRKVVQRVKKQLEKKNERIDQAKDKILREANEKAREILQEAKDTADETIRAFQKASPNASMKDLEKQREKLRGKISDKNEKLAKKQQPAPASGVKPNQLKLGESVKIVTMGLTGTVSSLPDNKGNLFVQCGIIRTQTNIKDLILVQEKDSATAAKGHHTGSGKIRMSKSLSVSTEINLLGKTVDEALAALDKYLDDAYLAHLPSVRVVHGKGTGALRNILWERFRSDRRIRSFRPGQYGEGDYGVTVLELK